MRDRHDSTPLSSANAFDRSFLDVLDPEDDPVTASEAAAEGPWTVVRLAAPKIPFADSNGAASNDAEPWAVVRADEPSNAEPAATFVHLHPARLAAAAVPIGARDAAYRLRADPVACGFALRRDSRLAGHLPWHHQELVATLNILDALARSPRALAPCARHRARGGGGDGDPTRRHAAGEEVGMRAGSGSIFDDPVARQRKMEEYWRRLEEPPKPPYSPRLRRDQIRALHYLKRLERRPMTKLAQEAVDRLLEEHGGAEAIVARGIAEFGDRGDERH